MKEVIVEFIEEGTDRVIRTCSLEEYNNMIESINNTIPKEYKFLKKNVMKKEELIHSEVMSITDGVTIMEEKETGRKVMSFDTDDYGTLEVGDVVVHKVIEVGNTYGDQTQYGVNYVETIKKSK